MPSQSEYGPVGFEGVRQAEADVWQNKLNEQLVGLGQAQIGRENALADESRSNAALKQIQVQQEQTLLKLQQGRLQQQSADPSAQSAGPGIAPDALLSHIEQDALDNMAAGKSKEAAALADKASLIRSRNAQITSAMARASAAESTKAINNAKLIDRLLGNVTDESSWRQSNMEFQSLTGHASPYANRPYDPQLVKQIRDQALTVKEKAELKIKQDDERSKEANRNNAMRNRDLSHNLDFIEKRAVAEQKAKAGKTNGSITPPAKDVKAAVDLLKTNYPKIDETDPGTRDVAIDLIERSQKLMRNHPGLTGHEAMQLAMGAQEQDGMYKKYQGKSGGATKDAAAKLPEKGARLQPNTWYTDGKSAKLWTDSGWSNDSSDEDDEDDNE